jgi:formylmethanofuran dehydrogenase subunit E
MSFTHKIVGKIIGDRTSKNAGDINCSKCGYYRGHPNTVDKNGNWKFVCSHCKNGYDSKEEQAEARLGA